MEMSEARGPGAFACGRVAATPDDASGWGAGKSGREAVNGRKRPVHGPSSK